ncbi:MAG: hypothetical protein AB2A00_08215 [Myxococcota bacterium]
MSNTARITAPVCLLAMTFLTACPPTATTGEGTRATISGRVELEPIAGLNDFSRVRVDLGRGEGGVPPDEQGNFEFTDLEPDVYTLTVTYSGGLTNTASRSAYKRLDLRVVARAGGSVSVGVLKPELGVGTVQGNLVLTDGAPVDGAEVTLITENGIIRTIPLTQSSFAIPDVRVGRYSVQVSKDGYAASRTPGASAVGVCTELVVINEDEETLELTPTALAPTTPAFAPGNGQVLTQTGNAWLLTPTTEDLTVQVTAAFAHEGRVWWEGEAPGEYLPFKENGYLLEDVVEGRHRVFFQFKDRCGYEARVEELVLTRDQTAPSIGSVTLSGGAAFTREPTLGLFVLGSDVLSEALELRLSLCNGTDAECDVALEDAPWTDYTTSRTVTFDDTDGVKLARVQLRDAAGNISDVNEARITLDRAAPVGTLRINGDAEHTASPDVVLTVSTADTVAAMSVMDGDQPSCDGAVYVPFQPNALHTLTGNDGEKTITLCLRDAGGNTALLQDAITLDRSAPNAPTLAPAGGLVATPTVQVMVATASVDTGVGLASPAYELLMPGAAEFTSWDGAALAVGLTEGENTVRARAVDAVGNRGAEGTVSFTLDTRAPVISLVTLAGGATYATSASMAVQVLASDATAGALQMRQSLCNDSAADCDVALESAAWGSYATSQTVTFDDTDGLKLVRIQVQDAAGNASDIVEARITLDRAAPTGSVEVNSNAEYTASPNVVLLITADDTVAQVGLLDGDAPSCDGAVYVPYLLALNWVLGGGDGEKTVTVCLRDVVGNTARVQDRIILDTTAPTQPRFAPGGGLTTVANSVVAVGTASVDVGGLAAPPYELLDPQGGAFQPWDGAARGVTLAEGENRFRVRAVDRAGNRSDEDQLVFTLDTQAPVPPRITRVAVLGGDVLVEFADETADVRSYLVHYGASDDRLDASFLDNGPSPVDVGRNKAVRLVGAPVGQPMFLAVSAVDQAGNVGLRSPVVRADVDPDSVEILSSFGAERLALLRGNSRRVVAALGNGFEVLELGGSAPEVLASVALDASTTGVVSPTAGAYFEADVDGVTRAFAAVAVPQRGDAGRYGDVHIYDFGDAAGDWSRKERPRLLSITPTTGEVTDLQSATEAGVPRVLWLEWRNDRQGERATMVWLRGAQSPAPEQTERDWYYWHVIDAGGQRFSPELGSEAANLLSFALVSPDTVLLAYNAVPEGVPPYLYSGDRYLLVEQVALQDGPTPELVFLGATTYLEDSPLPPELQGVGTKCAMRLGLAQPPLAGDRASLVITRRQYSNGSACVEDYDVDPDPFYLDEQPLGGCLLGLRPGADGVPTVDAPFPSSCDERAAMVGAQVADDVTLLVGVGETTAVVRVLDTSAPSPTSQDDSTTVELQRISARDERLARRFPAAFTATGGTARIHFLRGVHGGQVVARDVSVARPLTNPFSPAPVDPLPGYGVVQGVVDLEGYVVVALENAIRVWDLAIPTQPKVASHVPLDGRMAMGLARWRDRIYAVGPDGLAIVDVTDPHAATLADTVPSLGGSFVAVGGGYVTPDGTRAPTLLFISQVPAPTYQGPELPVKTWVIDDVPYLADTSPNPNYGLPYRRDQPGTLDERGFFRSFNNGHALQLTVHDRSLIVQTGFSTQAGEWSPMKVYLVDQHKLAKTYGQVFANDDLETGHHHVALAVDGSRMWISAQGGGAGPVGEAVMAFGLPSSPAAEPPPGSCGWSPCSCVGRERTPGADNALCFRRDVTLPDVYGNDMDYAELLTDTSTLNVIHGATALMATSGTLLFSPYDPTGKGAALAEGTALIHPHGGALRARGLFGFKQAVEGPGYILTADGRGGLLVLSAAQGTDLLPLADLTAALPDVAPRYYSAMARRGSTVVGTAGGLRETNERDTPAVVLMDFSEENAPVVRGIYRTPLTRYGPGTYDVERSFIEDSAISGSRVLVAVTHPVVDIIDQYSRFVHMDTSTVEILDARFGSEGAVDPSSWGDDDQLGCAEVAPYHCRLSYPLRADALGLTGYQGLRVRNIEVDGDVVVLNGQLYAPPPEQGPQAWDFVVATVALADLLHAAETQAATLPLLSLRNLGPGPASYTNDYFQFPMMHAGGGAVTLVKGVDNGWPGGFLVERARVDRLGTPEWTATGSPYLDVSTLNLDEVVARGSLLVASGTGWLQPFDMRTRQALERAAVATTTAALGFHGRRLMLSGRLYGGAVDAFAGVRLWDVDMDGGPALRETHVLGGGREVDFNGVSGGAVSLPFGILWADRGVTLRLLTSSR